MERILETAFPSSERLGNLQFMQHSTNDILTTHCGSLPRAELFCYLRSNPQALVNAGPRVTIVPVNPGFIERRR